MERTPAYQAELERESDREPGVTWHRVHLTRTNRRIDTAGICERCGAMGDTLAVHCKGVRTLGTTDSMVRRGRIDFFEGEWLIDPIEIAAAREVLRRGQT